MAIVRPRLGDAELRAGRRGKSRLLSSEDIWGHVFIAPWLVGFVVFTLGPFVVSFYLSFTKYELYGMPTWIGLKNYVMLFNGLMHRGGDSTIAVALFNTIYYTVFSVPAWPSRSPWPCCSTPG